jgi:hypothetical protein
MTGVIFMLRCAPRAWVLLGLLSSLGLGLRLLKFTFLVSDSTGPRDR